MANWEGLVNTTLDEYIKGFEDNVMRNRKLPALLRDRGRYSFNHAGLQLNWGVRYKRATMQGYADSDTISYARVNRFKRANLPWRAYIATDSVSEFEKEQNKGSAALIEIFSDKIKHLTDDVEEHIGDEYYIDGNASGNSKKFHGVESFMGTSGANTGNYIYTPSDSYAGLNTDLANYGGTWTGTWPIGLGSAEYDFWTPLIINYTDSAWAATTKTWPNTCLESMRFGIDHAQRNKSKKGMLDLITMTIELYRQLKDKVGATETIYTTKGSDNGLLKLGFTDVINFDGVDVTKEYGIPSGTAYGWSLENLEVKCLTSQFITPDPMIFDETTRAYRFGLKIMGNMQFNPRYFVKWRA